MGARDAALTNGNQISNEDIEDEITQLETQLESAKLRLKHRYSSTQDKPIASHAMPNLHGRHRSLTAHQGHSTQLTLNPDLHFLSLLSDSALPLGSFAFSSGLESYLAHSRLRSSSSFHPAEVFATFFPLSLSAHASTTLPFVLAAYRGSASLPTLDDALDAAVVCTVARRASALQGRALLALWEKSFASSASFTSSPGDTLAGFAALLRAPPTRGDDLPPRVSAHLAPLFGAVAARMGLGAEQAAYVYLLGHAKALVSAAVRASCIGSYVAQRMLAADRTRMIIEAAMRREWDTEFEEAGQNVPVMDLWIGRHELLYSRIFNS
jgi:urease accessory protein